MTQSPRPFIRSRGSIPFRAGPAHLAAAALAILIGALACTPTVKIESPKEPIVINLNIKIDHELRVKVDKEIDDLFDDNADIFGSAASEGADEGGQE